MAYDIMFAALGDSTRRQIFDKLKDGPASVALLSAGMAVSRPAVSQHLKILKQAGLLSDHAEGARRIYRIEWAALRVMRDYIEQFWAAELERQHNERLYG